MVVIPRSYFYHPTLEGLMASFPADVGEIPLYRGDSRTLMFVLREGTVDGTVMDLTGYGTVVTASARKSPDGTVLLDLDTSSSDLVNGIVAAAVSPDDWVAIDAQFSRRSTVGFDIQIADADGSRVTTVVAGKFVVSPDFTHADV